MAHFITDGVPGAPGSSGFLGSGLQPAKSAFCGALSLKTALFVVAAVDILLGMLYLLESVLLILVNGLLPEEFTELVISLVGNFVSLVVIPFSMMGMRGLKTNNWFLFHSYFLYKCFETFFICLYSPSTSYIYCYGQGWQCEVITLLCLFGQKIAVDVYFTYLAWSQDVCFQRQKQIPGIHSLELIPVTMQDDDQDASE